MKKLLLAPLVILLTIIIASTVVVSAQSADSNQNASQGLQVSPPRVELNAIKGKNYNIDISATNVTESAMTYYPTLRDFTASGNEDGTPKLAVDDTLAKTASIRSWVADIPSFELGPNESRKITIQLTVPEDAEPGGHYGAVLFSGAAPQMDTTGVGLSASTGVLLLVKVDGDITEKSDLISFYTALGDQQTYIFESSPVNFVARIENTGNVHVKTVGQIVIKDMFGNVVTTLDVNKDSSNVLPKSIRRFESIYDSGPQMLFGHYTADIALGYGTKGQAITRTIDFWVIPYKLILAGLAVLITLIYIFKKFIKSYNRRIAEKVRHEIANKDKNHQGKKN